MIAVICAMKEERDALIKLMEEVRIEKGDPLLYHGEVLDNEYYRGFLEGKETVVCRCGVGQAYAAMSTLLCIQKYHPDLLINLGCAGSLNPVVHVGDVVAASAAANWRIDVPGWPRGFDSLYCSFACDQKALSIAEEISKDLNVHIGPIVSADEFIYRKDQVTSILEHFPQALCGEMEGYAVACASYAGKTPFIIIRSISDETLVQGNFQEFEFNLSSVCEKAALFCKRIIARY